MISRTVRFVGKFVFHPNVSTGRAGHRATGGSGIFDFFLLPPATSCAFLLFDMMV